MTGMSLRSGLLREFKPLGEVGRPVFTAAPQVRAMVQRLFGAEYAAMLAVPQLNQAGDSVDWYAPTAGTVVPWPSASLAERTAARQQLLGALDAFHRHGASLDGLATTSENAAMFARMLPLALRIPDRSHIYLVDGRPVLTFWGFSRLDAPPEDHVIRDLDLEPSAPAVTAAPVAAAVPPLAAAAPLLLAARPWWRRWWWLWPLLLLLLLLLLFGLWGPRGCSGPLPGIPPLPGAPALPQGPEPPVVPAPDTPTAEIPVAPASPTLPAAPVPPAAETPAAPVAETVPPRPEPPPEPEPATPPPAPQQEGLTLPDEALKQKNTDFLDGHWRSYTDLFESRTGKPVTIEYDFSKGKGQVTITLADGTKCTGPVTASIQQQTLVLDEPRDPRCPRGGGFNRSKVECRQVPGSAQAQCQGRHQNGGQYYVEITR